MRTPGHTVNRGLVPPPPMPAGMYDGVDLATAQDRVRAAGGDVEIFMMALGWAATSLTEEPTRESLLTLSACAAWRAGVIGIRLDALRRAGSHEALAPAVAAALLMRLDALPAFLAAQSRDPFAWTAPLPDGEVARIGGFAGLGGPWLRPPTAFGQLARPHEFWVAADDRLVLLRADIFGHRLSTLADEAPAQHARAGARLEPAAEHSYLLRIVA